MLSISQEMKYARQYHETQWYRRQYRMSLIINVVVVIACALLAAYLVYHKHDPQVIQSSISAEEYQQLLQQKEAEKISMQRKIVDLTALNKILAAQIKTRNYVIAQYESQLKAVAVSVSPQPVILEAVRNEAATPAGFKAVVARAFGSEIAGRVEVRP